MAKASQERFENDTRQPRDLFKNRHSDHLKKTQLTLSQRMLKKGDVNDDDDDASEVRTSASQKCATATLSTEDLFPRNQYFF